MPSDPLQKHLSRLEEALQSLKAPPPKITSQGREVLSGSDLDPRLAFDREINRTILRRKLTFLNDRAETLSVDVMDRRILRLTQTDDTGIVLNPEDTAAKQRGATLVAGFCSGITSLQVQSALCPQTFHEDVIGLPTEALHSAPDASGPPSSEIEDYAQSVRPRAIAGIIMQQGEVSQKWGNPDVLARLAKCAEQAEQIGSQTCTIWTDPSSKGLCIGVARSGASVLWVAAKPSAMQDICAAWALLLH